MAYLHGVEITEVKEGAYPIAVVNSSIIGLVGTALGVDGVNASNQLIGVGSLAQARELFGPDKGGFTIMSALKTIFDNGGAYCVVVNVVDHAAAKALLDAKTGQVAKDKDGAWATGVYTAKIGAAKTAAPPTTPPASSTSPAKAADFTAQITQGLALLANAESELGYKPKVLIAPGYAHIDSVLAVGVNAAAALKGIFIGDVLAEKPADVAKAVDSFTFSPKKRAILCYPTALRYNVDEGSELQQAGLSQFVAAAIAARDQTEGYWVSPSNYAVSGIAKSAVTIRSSINDPLADTSLLNNLGVVTLFRTFGTGYRIWGNWTAAGANSNKTIHQMIAPLRVRDVVEESIQQASLVFLDRPINSAVIDAIKESVNAFLRLLVGRGAIVDGSCAFNKDKNPAEEIAQGRLTFSVDFAPSPSLDRLTFESFVDIALLNKLTS